jgi:hypothetical protein
MLPYERINLIILNGTSTPPGLWKGPNYLQKTAVHGRTVPSTHSGAAHTKCNSEQTQLTFSLARNINLKFI